MNDKEWLRDMFKTFGDSYYHDVERLEKDIYSDMWESSKDNVDEFFTYLDDITKSGKDKYSYGDTVTGNLVISNDKATKGEDGMYEINVDLEALMDEWLDTKDFRTTLSVAEIMLIKNFLKAGKYSESDRDFLKDVRKRWIEYNKKSKK
jgi:hypothetical protein